MPDRTSLAAVAYVAAICFTHLHHGTLSVDAIRYAGIAGHVLETGDWAHLYDPYEQRPYTNKPPLLLWAVAASMRAFGFGTAAAKLPAVACAGAALLVLFRLVRRWAGEVAAFAALLLTSVNSSFFKDAIDLSFEGLVLLGTALCFTGIHDLTEQGHGARGRAGPALTLGVGLALLLQSKAPYVLFVGFAGALPLLLAPGGRPDRRPPRLDPVVWTAAGLPVALALAWFALAGGDYAAAMAQNQVGDVARVRTVGPVNLAHWVPTIVIFLAPASWVVAWMAVARLRGGGLGRAVRRRWRGFELFLLGFTVPALATILVANVRPRYLLVPLVAGIVFAARELAGRLTRVPVRAIQTTLFAVAVACVVAFTVLRIPIHLENPVVVFLEANPGVLDEVAADRVRVCVDTKTDDHPVWKQAQYTEVLLHLTYGLDHDVAWSRRDDGRSLAAPAPGTRILAEKRCRGALFDRGLALDELEPGDRASLLVVR